MISYRDLALLIVFLIFAGLGIYAFVLFANLNAILKNIREMQNKHRNSIDETLDMLPAIVRNLDQAAVHVKDGAEKVTEAVDTVGEAITETVVSVNAGTREAAEYIKIISDIVKVIIETIRK